MDKDRSDRGMLDSMTSVASEELHTKNKYSEKLPNFSKHDARTFSHKGAQSGQFTIEEAREACKQVNVERSLDETGQGLVFASENILKVMLGIALSRQDKRLFESIVEHLSENIAPFSSNFAQVYSHEDKNIFTALLELSLKACILSNDILAAREVIGFSKKHFLTLTVDMETIWFAIGQTQRGQPMDSDYMMLRMLLRNEILYSRTGLEIQKSSLQKAIRDSLEEKRTINNNSELTTHQLEPTIDVSRSKNESRNEGVKRQLSGESFVLQEDHNPVTNRGQDLIQEMEETASKRDSDSKKASPANIAGKVINDIAFKQLSRLNSKYLRVSDILEQMLGMMKFGQTCEQQDILSLLIQMADIANYEQTVTFLIQNDMYVFFLDLEFLCSSDNKIEARDSLVTAMFKVCIDCNEMAIALHMISLYESILLQNFESYIQAIREKLIKDEFVQLEAMLMIVQRTLPEFHFKSAEAFVTIMEKLHLRMANQDGVALRWTNPLMVFVLVIDILKSLSKSFRSLSLRINAITQSIIERNVEIFDNYSHPLRLEVLLQQRDLRGRTVLEYMAELQIYQFLKLNRVNRIISGLWQSKVDIGGSVFELSTSYDLLFKNAIRFKEDREQRKRFYMPRDIMKEAKPHACTFMVWQKSKSLRYLIEAAIFFILMIVFQYEVSIFNYDLRLSGIEVKVATALIGEIQSRGGTPYQPGVEFTEESETEIETLYFQNLVQEESESVDERVNDILANGGGELRRRVLQEEFEAIATTFPSLSLYELKELNKEAFYEIQAEFKRARDELQLVLDLTIICFFFPVALFCKYVFAKLTDQNFIITAANILDQCIFVLVVIVWIVVDHYDHTEIKYPLFNEEVDQLSHVKFMGNVIEDVQDDVFHFDFLLAALTATLWMRCIVLLRLTEQFGPMIVMIYSMILIIVQFFVIYILGLITFACIATLTLPQIESFRNTFDALRIYLMASLGNFDIIQYDELDGWKRYYGIGLHVAVLFFNMLILINLLIAIMADEYGFLSNVKVGLYWANVVREMPKYGYSKLYGVLSMLPFVESGISLILMPFVLGIKDNTLLHDINYVCFVFVYFPISLIALVLFMAVNLVLLPFAYFKTVFHKVKLYLRYRGQAQLSSMVIFILLGIFFLLAAQVTDAYYFLIHAYSSNQRRVQEKTFHDRVNIKEFEKLLKWLKVAIKHGTTEMYARDLIDQQREKLAIVDHIKEYLFTYHYKLADQNAEDGFEAKDDSFGDADQKRRQNLRHVKTFNRIKSAIWGCVLDEPDTPNKERKVDLVLLRDLMLELQTFITYNQIVIMYESRLASRRSSSGVAVASVKNEQFEYTYPERKRFAHILHRFSVMNPALLRQAVLTAGTGD